MGFRVTWGAARRQVGSWLRSVEDALPPYQHAEGHLTAGHCSRHQFKEADPAGRYYIFVESTRIEVDRATAEILAVGEDLKVRYTRRGRAINIDRLVPSANGWDRS